MNDLLCCLFGCWLCRLSAGGRRPLKCPRPQDPVVRPGGGRIGQLSPRHTAQDGRDRGRVDCAGPAAGPRLDVRLGPGPQGRAAPGQSLEEMIISRWAGGMTIRDIQDHLAAAPRQASWQDRWLWVVACRRSLTTMTRVPVFPVEERVRCRAVDPGRRDQRRRGRPSGEGLRAVGRELEAAVPGGRSGAPGGRQDGPVDP